MRILLGKFLMQMVLLVIGMTTIAGVATIQSISRIAVGPDNILFVADWKAAKLHALDVPTSANAKAGPFNINDLSGLVGQALKIHAPITIEDMVMRRGAAEAFVAASVGKNKAPLLVSVTADQKVRRIDLKKVASSLDIANPPDPKATFWHDIPQRSLTVTDMKWHDGELFVAGLSNQSFASTLRRVRYPFSGMSISTVEMYHTIHNQMETRAPIEVMEFAQSGDKPYLIAAYTCTPLVVFALDDLKDGAHVKGKTIAELGYGNEPASMMMTRVQGQDGQSADYLVITNYQRGANVIPMSEIEAAYAKPGLDAPVPIGQTAGVTSNSAPLVGVVRTAELNDSMLLALRHHLQRNTTQLVSFVKGANFRLSDFISDFVFADYKYGEWTRKNLKPFQDMLMQGEGFSDLIKP
ncbi:hypothetical protein ACUHMQ_13040 [Chitinimonas sp. PSY-7]|uniref:hypothetical protein n=1 Tax=Chitinimonas sp. PSY-7 TaxID=3459088 RepID=UPI00403FD314